MAASRFWALLAGVEQAKERQAWILRTEQRLKQRLWKKNTPLEVCFYGPDDWRIKNSTECYGIPCSSDDLPREGMAKPCQISGLSPFLVIGFCFERRPAKCGRWRHAHYWWGRVGPLNCSSGCSDVVPLSVELPRKWFSSKNQQEICVYIYHPSGMWRLFGLQKRLSIKSIILSAPGLCRGDSHPLTWYNPCLFGCFFLPQQATLPRSWWLNPHEFLLFGGYSCAMLRMVSQGRHSGARTS